MQYLAFLLFFSIIIPILRKGEYYYMLKQNQCIDFCGEKLKVGDEVIPMLGETLIIGIDGIISKIEYSERYNNHYITITDKKGNILLENVDARCYTTQARYDERVNQEYV